MPTIQDMKTSLEDATFFDAKINEIVRGPEAGHDLAVIRPYFRAYLHCWKTVLDFVRAAKGLSGKKREKEWINWAERWQQKHLDKDNSEIMDQLRETRAYDTHDGTIE